MKRVLIRSVAFMLTASGANAQAPLPRWSLTDEVRFGEDSRDETTLTGGRHLIVGRDGNVYVAQPADGAIRVFGATGTYIRTLGRRGQGPGEFQDLHRIGFVRDTIWALDSRTSRVSFFSVAGKFLRSERISSEGRGEYFPSSPWTLLSSGTVVSIVSSRAERMPGTKVRIPLIKLERSGRVLDTIAWRESANSTGEVQFRGATKGKLVFSQPFADSPIFTAEQSGNGFVIVDTRQENAFSTTFAVSRYGPMAQLVSQVRVPFQPVELTPRMAEGAVKTFLAGPRPPSVEPSDILRVLYRPRFVPPVSDATIGRDGSVWLRGPDLGQSTFEYTILSPAGKLVATVNVPRRLFVRSADDRFVWLLGTDTDDVPFAARYRIVRP